MAAYREPLRVSDAAPDSLLEGNGFELSVPRCAGTGDSAAVVTPPDPGSEWRLLGPPLDNSVGVPKPATARMTGAPVDWPQLGRTHENRWLSKRGTERSNPFPSSGESVANSVIAKAGPRLLSAAGTSGFAIRMLRRILTTCGPVAPPSPPRGWGHSGGNGAIPTRSRSLPGAGGSL